MITHPSSSNAFFKEVHFYDICFFVSTNNDNLAKNLYKFTEDTNSPGTIAVTTAIYYNIIFIKMISLERCISYALLLVHLGRVGVFLSFLSLSPSLPISSAWLMVLGSLLFPSPPVSLPNSLSNFSRARVSLSNLGIS